jgi:hypothetical protein
MYLYIPDVFGSVPRLRTEVMNSGSVALGAGEENPKTFMVVRASLSVIVVAGYVLRGVGRVGGEPTYGTLSTR